MSRGPGRWQQVIIAALGAAGNGSYVNVTDVAIEQVERSLTPSEYRAVNRAVWLLKRRGRLHLALVTSRDYRGRTARILAAWTCFKCSAAATGEHLPTLPCFYCKAPTEERNLRNYPDCGCAARECREDPGEQREMVAAMSELAFTERWAEVRGVPAPPFAHRSP
jgi:hypothetical protein